MNYIMARWTEEEITYLNDNIDVLSNEQFANHFNKSVRSIESVLKRKAIKRFNPNDIEFDMNDLETMTLSELVEKYKCSKSFILKIKSQNGLNKHELNKVKDYVPKEDEVFKPVHFGGEYRISNYGNLLNKENVLMQPFGADGFSRINLVIPKGKRSKYFIHRLVAEVFLDNPDGLPYVKHKDGDKDNNHVSNLEWYK